MRSRAARIAVRYWRSMSLRWAALSRVTKAARVPLASSPSEGGGSGRLRRGHQWRRSRGVGVLPSETAVLSVVDAIQLFGAEGYTQAAGIGVELLDSVGGLSYSGTSDIQRNIIASMLGVDRPARDERRLE